MLWKLQKFQVHFGYYGSIHDKVPHEHGHFVNYDVIADKVRMHM